MTNHLNKINITYRHLRKCLIDSLNNKSKIPSEIGKQWIGMSGLQMRFFLNNICSLPNSKYLEIGLWKGSTFFSSIYKNNLIQAVGIDNWSEFGGPKNEFLKELNNIETNSEIAIYDGDCFSIDIKNLLKEHGKFNIYFYDGPHELEDQIKAFTYFDSILDDVFIAIIDDLRQPEVRIGTSKAFHQLEYDEIFSIDMFGSFTPPDTESACAWYNGVRISLISKNKELMKGDRGELWKLLI